MPKHVIFGDADDNFPATWGRRWADALPGATFDIIPGAGHCLQEEAGEEIVAVALKPIQESLRAFQAPPVMSSNFYTPTWW